MATPDREKAKAATRGPPRERRSRILGRTAEGYGSLLPGHPETARALRRLRAALEVRGRVPGTAILVLSQYVEERYAGDLLAGGAQGVGYLLKDRVADVGEFLAAVHRVGEGGAAIDPEVVAQLLGRRRRADPLASLSPRELDVLSLMAEGRSNAAIADRLVITEGAVEKHISSIFGKLGLPAAPSDHRRVLAVLTFLRA